MKLKVIKDFQDKITGEYYQTKSIIEISKARSDELLALKYVEEINDTDINKSEDNKYSELTFDELKNECKKNEIKFGNAKSKNTLINLLNKAKK